MVTVQAERTEHGIWLAHVLLEKRTEEYDERLAALLGRGLSRFEAETRAGQDVKPYDTYESIGNLLVNAGINNMWTILCSAGGTKYDSGNARIGVGDGNGSVPTPAATDTDLTAPTNKLRNTMKATFPTYGTSQKATWAADFATGDANWVWREWGIFNAASGATSMLNHKGESLGAKSSGTWTLTVDVTLS